MKGETYTQRLKEYGRTILIVIGAITVVRFAVTMTHATYLVKLTLEDVSVDSEREPIAYLEKRWLFNLTQYPLRFRIEDDLNDWQYEKDGKWHSLYMTEIGTQIDVNFVPDDSDRNIDGW